MAKKIVYKDKIFEVWLDLEAKTVGCRNLRGNSEFSMRKSRPSSNFYEFSFRGRQNASRLEHYEDFVEYLDAIVGMSRSAIGKGKRNERDFESVIRAYTKIKESIIMVHKMGTGSPYGA